MLTQTGTKLRYNVNDRETIMKRFERKTGAVVASILCLGLAACSDNDHEFRDLSVNPAEAADPADLGPANIVDTAVAAGSFNTLASALQATGLDSVLADGSRNFTVFAPTDEAFAALGEDTINGLLADTDTLRDILLYHVVPDAVVNSASAITLAGQTVTAANGDDFAVSLDDGNLFINMSQVVSADVGASNGVIHVIDKVLLPPADMPTEETTPNIVDTAIAAGSFNTLVAALQATGLDATLASEGPFTVFAPTDAAFAELGDETINALLADPETLSDILLYHVIPGASVDSTTAISLAGTSAEAANGDEFAISLDDGNLFINMSQVTSTDIMTSNGIIHVIDKVLLPPADMPTDTGTPNIVDTAVAAGSFTTLVAALQATGLDSTLAGAGPFTVFAPTDAAFDALGQDTINALLDDTDTLSDILLYHVIAGQAVDAATAISLAGNSVTTANEDDIALRLDGGSLFINDSMVVTTDITTSNGIIHVIDAVLLPPSDVAPEPTPTGTIYEVAKAAGFETLIAAAEIAGLKDALNHPGDIYTVFAPTDAAFQALGAETINALVADPDTLRDILLFHVIPGTVVDAETAMGLVGVEVTAGNGGTLMLSHRDDGLYINDSRITVTDVEAVNGIIHVIDAVLLPPKH